MKLEISFLNGLIWTDGQRIDMSELPSMKTIILYFIVDYILSTLLSKQRLGDKEISVNPSEKSMHY